tara:strand:- start:1240 stop:3420 length:2181 start_codon:yes stop_codon:yes gene_type:complete
MKKFVVKIFVILFLLSSNLFAEVKPTLLRTVSLTNIVKSPSDVRFNPAGTRIFFSDFRSGENVLIQFDVDTPFNISTIDFNSKVELATNGGGIDNITDPQGFEFNSDGTKVFAINDGGGFNAHLLSTPYDFSNATMVADDGFHFKTDPDPDIANNRAVKFNLDGTKMFLIDVKSTSKRVIEFNLSTPYDTSTVSQGNSFNISENNTTLQDLSFDDDGTRMYLIESAKTPGTTFIYVYKLSSGFDITTATFAGKVQQVFEDVGSDGTNGTPLGMGFSENGMKFYQVTYQSGTEGNRDRVHEYDLTCPYGIVICETDAVTAIGAQVEIAKNVIYQNSSTIFKRFDWLRRNDERTNLTNHEIKMNIHNPILAALKTNLENSLNNIEYTQASLKKGNSKINKKNWSYWSHGDISFGRVGDTASSKPKEVKTRGIMFGADKLVDKKIFGYAFRYGNDEVDIDDGSSDELDAQTFSLNIYSSVPLKNRSNLNLLFGASYLMIDQLGKDQVTGQRNGKQIYTSMSYENENEYTKYELIPFAKLEMGITQFSDYTDFGVVSNSVESHERLTFKTGNISAGLKFDDILYLDDNTISRNGFIEYIYDLTPNIDHYVKNHLDNTTLKKTINTHSLNNVKGNIGFEYINPNGRTIAINYERFQSLDKSGHKDSLLIKFGSIKKHSANFDVIYDPINNNNTKISYLKQLGDFNLKLNSNYSLFSKIPDYGANIEISGTF